MRIDIVYKDKTDGHDEFISTFYDMSSDPFNVGDEINLSVNNIPPVELSAFKDMNKQQQFIDKNNEKKKLFDRKKVKLIERNVYNELRFFNEDNLIIEYFCDFVEK